MSFSPWNKRFLIPGQKKKLPPPASQPNQLPNTNTPISLKLSGSELVYEGGSWKQGKGPAPSKFPTLLQ